MTADTVGGVWSYALELVRALEPHGVKVALATMGAPLSPEQRKAADALENLEVFESAYRLEWMDDPWEDVAAAGAWLLGLERELQPDLIHLNGYVHAALPWSAPTMVVGHSCVLSWWEAVKGEAAPAQWQRYEREVRRGLQAADRVVAPTGAMLGALAKHYGPLPRSTIIPNGTRADLFMPHPKEPFISAAGRLWDEAKNIATVAAVAEELEWPVYVAGNAKHPGGEHIHFEGVTLLGYLPQPELAMWLGRAAIYVHPARYEPFGLAVLEAALCGCALVLGDIPSLREVWDDAAVYVEPDDHEALRERLLHLTQHPDERERLARRALERARRYTSERMAAGYLGLYKNLCERVTA